ncbi:methyltransferase domain-containing protein [Paenibacillus alginolyticus]|uniref:Methyltransferase domain-containing protein n=1 Tax=Paenibacillus alginolyticus TaxID=59839 RepID=A0ABT4GGK1_9BACL|nr:methyltransferase domain-containing protein [Paenibacillus alginolyticus]MCY9695322.1 methyltransferase domain-containing protein [Paenibacillus alginolyticus]MEC0144786.1 methyltransferase domain-containing protein [Paenibacillus alginolyticus]
MFRGFKHRAKALELMDDHTTGGLELREALRHLQILNRIFGAAGPTLYGLQRLWMEADKPRRLSVLDIGSGSGDVNRHILRWADENRIDLKITLVDITEEACEEARLLFRNEPRVDVIRNDLFELPEGCADVITGTQFVHHFNTDELPNVINCMLKASRLGVVINDIHRHWIPWAAVWLTARIVSSNRYIVNDGPLSVAKGFRSEDWNNLRNALSAAKMFYSWRPLFRYVIVVWKSNL